MVHTSVGLVKRVHQFVLAFAIKVDAAVVFSSSWLLQLAAALVVHKPVHLLCRYMILVVLVAVCVVAELLELSLFGVIDQSCISGTRVSHLRCNRFNQSGIEPNIQWVPNNWRSRSNTGERGTDCICRGTCTCRIVSCSHCGTTINGNTIVCPACMVYSVKAIRECHAEGRS